MKIVNNVLLDQRQGGDTYVKAAVVAGMIVTIPSALPIQQWTIATKTLSDDSPPPRYSAPQYINADKAAPAGTRSRNATTSGNLNCLTSNFSVFLRTKARPT